MQKQPILTPTIGAKVKVKTKSGIKTAKIVAIDESVFPGKITVEDDDGERHDVYIGLGWPD